MDFLNTPAVIPVDQEYGSRSFDTDDEDGTSAFSVTSSVYNFRVENGRRYHDYKDGHPFPHDQVSEENEVCMHEMCLSLLDDKFYVSPIDESQLRNVADVGTGMGLWAEGMAEKYPDTEVVGIDLTPHERPTHPNCSYIISDATDEWVLDDPSTKFDLVHIRSLFVGVKDWPALYKQCFENMRSGGWIEQLEVVIDPRTDDGTDISDSVVKQVANISVPMGEASGRDFHVSMSMKSMIEQAGFVDVHEQTLKLPLGPWASDQKYKDVGRFYERFYKTGLQGWLLHICTRNLGWSVDQVNDACVKAFQEINSRKYLMYFPFTIVVGRKP
ncbi:hypothetical protein B0A52_10257 [Exophiala mesophila]|uniref:Methyltransferase domain-containing protein n=1 Tax=Exophiala mesophila TaxID=212818 RepID=A0A438MS59_EXOME|nr:hypothetical protein B0A52_10257 [Exophiala mesophila]